MREVPEQQQDPSQLKWARVANVRPIVKEAMVKNRECTHYIVCRCADNVTYYVHADGNIWDQAADPATGALTGWYASADAAEVAVNAFERRRAKELDVDPLLESLGSLYAVSEILHRYGAGAVLNEMINFVRSTLPANGPLGTADGYVAGLLQDLTHARDNYQARYTQEVEDAD